MDTAPVFLTVPICATYVHVAAGWAAALQCWEPNSEREREGQHEVFRLTAVVWPHNRMRQPRGLRRPASTSVRLDRRRSGIGSQAISVRGGRLSWRHLETRRSVPANAPVRGHQRQAEPLQGSAQTQGLAFAIAKRSTVRKARVALARRLAIIMHAMLRNETEFAPA